MFTVTALISATQTDRVAVNIIEWRIRSCPSQSVILASYLTGIAAYVKALRPDIKVIGVEADDAAGESSPRCYSFKFVFNSFKFMSNFYIFNLSFIGIIIQRLLCCHIQAHSLSFAITDYNIHLRLCAFRYDSISPGWEDSHTTNRRPIR